LLSPAWRKAYEPCSYAGFYLDVATKLDCACPGFLTSSFYAIPLRRQAQFCTFAEIDFARPQPLAERLSALAPVAQVAGLDPLAKIARALVTLHPLAILNALYRSVPQNFIRLLEHLGPDPVSVPEFYRTALSLLSEPRDQARAHQPESAAATVALLGRLMATLGRQRFRFLIRLPRNRRVFRSLSPGSCSSAWHNWTARAHAGSSAT